MSILGNKTEITQIGQAITINGIAASSLSQIFSSCIGPKGKYKMLISPSGEYKITSDGYTLLTDLNFSHPTCLVINKAAGQTYSLVGDGVSTFIFFCSEIFLKSFSYYQNGANIQNITSGIKIGIMSLNKYLNEIKKPFDENSMHKLTLTSLKTKLKPKIAEIISKITVDSFLSLANKPNFDINMIEIMEMGEGNINESRFVNGLVLDHAGRHPLMPKYLENVLIIISNISLEYEKVEINAGFYYSSVEQRQSLVTNERIHILNRANKIVEFAKDIKKRLNKNIVFITDKGIDPFSLEILAKDNILGLRRTKRKNLERLIRMCGGNLITSLDDLKEENLGECKKVSIQQIKDEKYTFLEGTPYSSCCILIRGNNRYEMKRISSSIRGAHKSLLLALKSPYYLNGGPNLFYKISKYLETIKIKKIEEFLGIKIVKEVCISMTKILLRNMDLNVENEFTKLEIGEYKQDEEIIDNFSVISQVVSNASMVAVTLLLVDDIIKAGKSVNEIPN